MSTQQRSRRQKKKYFTVAQANATLPLLRQILRDVTSLAKELSERYERIKHLQADKGKLTQAHNEEMQTIVAEFERGQDKMREYEDELRKLHIELKDHLTGLVDFRAWVDDHEVYLCWRLGEPEVAHWHELDSGFSGRKKLMPDAPETRMA
jgi:hypothetical protein